MIEKLIEEGKKLESEVDNNNGYGKFFESVNFEKWVSKSILYFENSYKESVLTEKAKDGYKTLNSNTNYAYYQFLLGTLMSIKEFEDNQAESFEI